MFIIKIIIAIATATVITSFSNLNTFTTFCSSHTGVLNIKYKACVIQLIMGYSQNIDVIAYNLQ